MAEQLIHDVLTEAVDWGASSSEDEIVRDVLLCGPKSKNGRNYSDRSFGGAEGVKALYEGRLVFLNHVKKDQHPQDRMVQEFAGVVQNARFTESGVRGDINTKGAPCGAILRGLHGARAKGVGMSHSVKGLVDPKNGDTKVTEVFSVDVVINPATTNSFTESTKMAEVSELLIKERDEAISNVSLLKEERDTANAKVVALEAQLKETKDNLDKLLTESNQNAGKIKELSDKLAVFEEAKAKQDKYQAVVTELHAVGLKEPVEGSADAKCIPESIMTILLGLDDDSRKALIAERASYVKAAPVGALPREQHGETNKFDAAAYNARFFKN